MTSTSSPSPPLWSWPQTFALVGLAWGLLEAGSWGREIVSALFSDSYSASVRLTVAGLMLLVTLVTLGIPVGLLLSRRRLSSLVYVLAAIPPALCAAFCLVFLLLGVEGGRNAVYIFLALVLTRAALAGALLFLARHRLRAQ